MRSIRRNRLLMVAALPSIILLAVLWQPISVWLAPPVQPPKTKLRIAVVASYVGSGLLYLAKANGYFSQQGLDVVLIPNESGKDALIGVREQRADLATCGDIPVMFAALGNLPVAVIATIFTASRAHGIVARRDRGIATLHDLKNKTVGIIPNTDGLYVLSTMLARHQATLHDVHVDSFALKDMLPALQEGRVDAISIWEPSLTRIEKALGDDAIMFRSDGRFLFGFNLVGDANWIDAHPDLTKRLLQALLEARRYVDSHPKQARSLIVSAMKLNLDTFDIPGPDYNYVLELNQNLLSTLEDQSRWAIQGGLVPQTVVPNFLRVIRIAPLLAVAPDAVTVIH